MSIIGKIQSLFSDREKTQPIFPITKTKAVSDDNGVSLDVLLEGKAPAGYGLGVTDDYAYASDANTVAGNGWFTTDENTLNLPSYIKGDHGHILTIGGTQIFVQSSVSVRPSLAIRKSTNGTFHEWEYMNPEMVVGVEYRTNERYNGKVVYAKLVDFGALPNNNSKSVGYRSSSSTGVVSLTAMISDGCCIDAGYARDMSRATSAGLYLDNTLQSIRIKTEYDLSTYTALVLVKYTID